MQSLLSLLAEPNQPDRLYQALGAELARNVGHRLFTLLCVNGVTMQRVFSSRPDDYPVSAFKPMTATPWGRKVLEGKEVFLGRDMAAISWAFFDHALIASLGLGSAITVPVIYNGTALGSMNLLHEEHFYNENHVRMATDFAPLLVPAFLNVQHSMINPRR
jgi:hypothetical protein